MDDALFGILQHLGFHIDRIDLACLGHRFNKSSSEIAGSGAEVGHGQARLQIEGLNHLPGFLILVSFFAIEMLKILLNVSRPAMGLMVFCGKDCHRQ